MTVPVEEQDPVIVQQVQPGPFVVPGASSSSVVVAGAPSPITLTFTTSPAAPITIVNPPPPPPPVVVSPTSSGDTLPVQYHLVAASSWYQQHGYSYPPEVRLIDSTGAGVDTEVEYPDDSHVSISFPTPFTGTVILS